MKQEPIYKRHPRLNTIYHGMIDRCLNTNNSNFHNYGGRGIVVCLEWIRNKESFIEWALANGYHENLTIDRIDVNGGYNPGNCRWATPQQQAQNKRATKYVTYRGEQKKLFEWCELLGLDYKTTYNRLFLCKWATEDAFNPYLNHKPREYTFQGNPISGAERENLLNVYRKIIDANYDFYEPGPGVLTRHERILELAEIINNSLSFFEFGQESMEKLFKIGNNAA
jgi:hypothetical protein